MTRLLSFYTFLYRYLFWFSFDSVVANTFVLLKHFRPHTGHSCTETYKKFRLFLAQQLIGNYNSRVKYSLPSAIQDVATRRRRHAAGHFPIKGRNGRCVYYSQNKRRHESNIRCTVRDVALCTVCQDTPDDGRSCFQRFHTP